MEEEKDESRDLGTALFGFSICLASFNKATFVSLSLFLIIFLDVSQMCEVFPTKRRLCST